MTEQIIYPETWSALTGDDDGEQDRVCFEGELQKELSGKHPLHRVPVTIVGRSWAKDEILVVVPDGRWAIVHLTYNGREKPPYPMTTFFDSVEALNRELEFRD